VTAKYLQCIIGTMQAFCKLCCKSDFLMQNFIYYMKIKKKIMLPITVKITEAWVDQIFQECALIKSEPKTVVLQLEPIKVLSVIGQ